MLNNKFNIKMFDNNINISSQIKIYLDEIKYIDEEINYWKIENKLNPSENIKIKLQKLDEELTRVKYNYSKFLIDNHTINNIKNS